MKINIWENHTLATILTFHLFKQALWEDVWKSFIREISHICNFCDFASNQAGNLRIHVKTNNLEHHTHATNVTLHLFNQAIWEDMWKLTFEKNTHMQLLWVFICSSRRFEKTFENYLLEKFRTSATIVTLHLFRQTIWDNMWKLTFEKTTHMQLMWLCICSIRRFEKTFENHLVGKFRISTTIVTFYLIKQAIWGHMKTHIWEINTANVTFSLFKQPIWEDMWKLTFGKIEDMHQCGVASVHVSMQNCLPQK